MKRFKDSILKFINKSYKNFKQKNIEEPVQPHNNFLDSIKQRDKKDIIFNINVFITSVRGILGYFLAAGIVLIGLGLGIGIGYVVSITSHQEVPTYSEMKKQLNDTDNSTSLYFAKNVKLGNVKSNLVRKQISFDEMSPYLKDAIVATEDSYFYKHKGIVPKSIVRAIFSDVAGIGSQNGGSTLTQQTVKMQFLSSETTWRRKATEILLAMRLDKYFTKDEILEGYLNAATFGHNNKGENVGGVEMASEGLFGVHAKDLTLSQAAFIAGLPQSPSVYTPFDEKGKLKSDISLGLKRKDIVLFRMYRTNKITKQQYQAAKAVNLKEQFIPTEKRKNSAIPYGYVYNLLSEKVRTAIIKELVKKDNLKYKDIVKNTDVYNRYWQQADTELRQKNYRIDSTIDKKMYDDVQDVTSQYKGALGEEHVDYATDPNTGKSVVVKEPVQNGSVILNNKTGAVLAFVGGVNYDDSQLNHAFDTKRSPGSSIKPLLVFAPAVENGLIGSKSMLADFKVKYKNYKPTDYGKTIQNRFVSAKETLQNSYNIPTVNLYNNLQSNNVDVDQYMSKMGIGLTNSEYKKLGTSLGGLDNGFTVQQQASAFSTFANKGQHINSFVVSKITDPSGKVIYQHHKKKKRVFSKGTSYIMQDMLKSVTRKGTASALTYEAKFNQDNFFGKTGTSNDYRDNWFVGSTPGVTISSWIGYDNFYGNNYNLSSSSSDINQEYWAQIANTVYKDNPKVMRLKEKFNKPATVKSAKVSKLTGAIPGAVSYRGYSHSLAGNTTSLYLKNAPKQTSLYKFAIGGSKANYKSFWNNYFGLASNYGVITYLDESIKNSDSSQLNLYQQVQDQSQSESDAVTPNNTTQSNNTSGNNIADDTASGAASGGSGAGGNDDTTDTITPPVSDTDTGTGESNNVDTGDTGVDNSTDTNTTNPETPLQ